MVTNPSKAKDLVKSKGFEHCPILVWGDGGAGRGQSEVLEVVVKFVKEEGCEGGVVVGMLTIPGVVVVGPGNNGVDVGGPPSLRNEATMSESSRIT